MTPVVRSPLRLALLPLCVATAASCVTSLDGGDGGDDDAVVPGSFCVEATPTTTRQASGRFAVTTAHYDLELAVDDEADAVDVARLAEAAWLAQQEHFGAAPEQRLQATWFATDAEWRADLGAAAGSSEAGAAGAYLPSTKRATMVTQPTRGYSRTLFLHELVHQFQFLARTNNQGSLDWVTEGLAEELARHDWDGRCVRLGVVPLATFEDYPAQALATVRQGFDLAALVSGTSTSSRPVYQQLWHFLGSRAATAAGLAEFSAAVDADPDLDVAAAFAAHVGDAAALGDDFVAWLPGAQEPVTPVFLEWEHVDGDSLRAWPGGAITIAVIKDTVAQLRVDASDVPSGSQAGVVVGYADSANYDAVLVDERGNVTQQMIRNNAATAAALGTAAGGPPWSFDVTWSDGRVTVTIGSTTVTATPGTPPRAGLAAYNARARFDGLSF